MTATTITLLIAATLATLGAWGHEGRMERAPIGIFPGIMSAVTSIAWVLVIAGALIGLGWRLVT